MSISVEHASCTLGGRTVLDDVSLEVTPGRVLVLVGPNGAGKSTLLGVMSGDIPLVHGSVTLEGRILSQWSTEETARRRSVLLQHNDVAFAFTVAEVVRMGRAPWPADLDEDTRLVDAAIDATDLKDFLDRPYRSLSGGERARVSLARVLAQNTPTVLLDEPTAALDLRHQEDIMRIARRLAAEGRAVVVVLHDLSLAAAYADDVAILCAGQLHSFGTPPEVLTPETIEDVYRLPVQRLSTSDGQFVITPRREALSSTKPHPHRRTT